VQFHVFFGIILLLSILYYIQGQAISDFVMPAIYGTWGVLIGMAIFPIYAFHRMKKGLPSLKATKKKRSNNHLLFIYSCGNYISWINTRI